MNIQPLSNRVLIKRIDVWAWQLDYKNNRAVKVLLTDAPKSIMGKVLAVGPGKRDEDGDRTPLAVKPGDLVYFNSKWSDMGADYQHPGYSWDDKLHLVQEADIFLIINA